MSSKIKVSLTIDAEVYEAVERASEAQKTARSRIAEDALRLWLKKQTESLMAKGYEEMAEEEERIAKMAFEAQKEIVK